MEKTDDVRILYLDLPYRIHGFCFHDDDMNPCIVINARDCWTRQQQTIRHELEHVRRGDMFDKDYKEYG